MLLQPSHSILPTFPSTFLLFHSPHSFIFFHNFIFPNSFFMLLQPP
jgi:hypothetical protein